MGLHKGMTNNPKGRPQGAKNRITIEVKERITEILDEHFTPEKICNDLNSIDPKERLQILLKLLDFTIPKMKQMDLTTAEVSDKIKIDYATMPTEELINRAKAIHAIEERNFKKSDNKATA